MVERQEEASTKTPKVKVEALVFSLKQRTLIDDAHSHMDGIRFRLYDDDTHAHHRDL